MSRGHCHAYATVGVLQDRIGMKVERTTPKHPLWYSRCARCGFVVDSMSRVDCDKFWNNDTEFCDACFGRSSDCIRSVLKKEDDGV